MAGPVFKLSHELPDSVLPWTGSPPLALQQLWFSVQRLDWSALVLIPADPQTSATAFGRPLYEVGKLAIGDRLRLLDARTVKVSGTAPMILDMLGGGAARAQGTEWSERVLVLVDSIISQPSAIPLVLAADLALLCIELGKTSLDAAQETLNMIGREKFAGCITLPAP